MALAVCAVVLVVGAVIAPRPPSNVDPARIVSKAMDVRQPLCPSAVGELRKAQIERCKPILEGSDRVAGHDSWAIRLKPPVRKYPWVEVWVDKHTGEVVAWKEWGKRGGHVTVLRQSPHS